MASRAIVFTLTNPDPEVAPLLLPVFGQPAMRPVGDIVDSVEQTLTGHFILQDRNRPGLGVDQTQVQWVPVTDDHQSILRADVAVHHHAVTSLEVPVQPVIKMFEGVVDLAALQQRAAFDAPRCSKGSSSVQGGLALDLRRLLQRRAIESELAGGSATASWRPSLRRRAVTERPRKHVRFRSPQVISGTR